MWSSILVRIATTDCSIFWPVCAHAGSNRLGLREGCRRTYCRTSILIQLLLATAAMADRFVQTNSPRQQLPNLCLRLPPPLPVARPYTPTQPLVEFAEHRLALFQTRVGRPPVNVLSQPLQSSRHRHAAIAACDLLAATFTNWVEKPALASLSDFVRQGLFCKSSASVRADGLRPRVKSRSSLEKQQMPAALSTRLSSNMDRMLARLASKFSSSSGSSSNRSRMTEIGLFSCESPSHPRKYADKTSRPLPRSSASSRKSICCNIFLGC